MKRLSAIMFTAVMLIAVGTTALAPRANAAAKPVNPSNDMSSGKVSTKCENQNRFLLFKPWFSGLVDDQCNIVSPAKAGGNDSQSGLQSFIWTIALNVIEDMLIAAGYACIGFIMYGGFKYMTSTGSPDGMTKAKQIIMNAVIGLVISLIAVGVVNLITNIFIS